jgi:hypothetical protein
LHVAPELWLVSHEAPHLLQLLTVSSGPQPESVPPLLLLLPSPLLVASVTPLLLPLSLPLLDASCPPLLLLLLDEFELELSPEPEVEPEVEAVPSSPASQSPPLQLTFE